MKNRHSVSGENQRSAQVRPLDWAKAAGEEDLVEAEMNACLRRRTRRKLMASALLLVGLISFGVWWRTAAPVLATPQVRPQMLLAERQVLPDGSIVDLKDGAVVSVEFGEVERRVSLAKGEAHFEVMRDTLRPFIVSARGVDVRAVGTAFLVQLEPQGVEVVVTEGSVAVFAPHSPEPASGHSAQNDVVPNPLAIRVDAGSRISIETGARLPVPPAVRTVAAADLAKLLAWRTPRIEFDSTPLVDVIAIFNRYAKVPLRFSDPELGALQLSGILRGDNVPVLLQILETSYGIRAEYGAEEIVLVRRQDAPP